MGRHKKSNADKIVDGTFDRNRSRHNHDEPEVAKDIGDPPAHMKKGLRDIWDEVVANHYAGCLGSGDRFALEVLCGLLYRFRKGHLKRVQELKTGELSQLTSLLAKFGMTPATRTGIRTRLPGGGGKSSPEGGSTGGTVSPFDLEGRLKR